MQVSLFGFSNTGKSKSATAQRRINCYYERVEETARGGLAIYGTPGLTLFTSFGESPVRGLHAKADFLYVVHNNVFWKVDSEGGHTQLGSLLTSSGRVSMADNGLQLMVVDGTYGYIYDFGAETFEQIVDADFPPAPAAVVFQDAYFIVNEGDTARFYVSDLYDGTAWNAADVASAESNPDDLIAVFADHGELILFGGVSTEFWSNVGASDFPYVRIQGSTAQWGLAAQWSVARYDNSVMFLAKNQMGEVIVAKMNGYTPQRVSNFDLEHELNSYNVLVDAVAYTYMLSGHPMYVISFPTEDKTWMYDGASNLWSELKSDGIGRHRSDVCVPYLDMMVASDFEDGKLYRIDQDSFTDNGDPIHMELVSSHLINQGNNFSVTAVEILLEAGVGAASGDGVNPQIMLQVSRDGGYTYGPERWAPMGKLGEYRTRARWRRLGDARDFVFKIKISDPVKRAIVGALVEL